jgi:sterol 14-demethylase
MTTLYDEQSSSALEAKDLPPLVSGRLPLIGHAGEFLRRPTDLLARGQAEHGNVYSLKLGNRLAAVLLGPEHSRFVFSMTNKKLDFKEAYPFVMRMFDPDFYFFADDAEYHRQRSIVLPRFQGKQLDSYINVMSAEMAALTGQMGNEGELDLIETFGPLVMRIAAQTLFGEDFGARLGSDEFHLFRRFSAGINGILPPWLPTPSLLLGLRARRELHRLLHSFVRTRRSRPLDRADFLQSFVEARYDDGSAVPDDVLVNLLLFLTWSGHETTTGHLCWGLIHLLQHPHELARVRAEEQLVLGSAAISSLEQVNQLKHLDNALHETGRLRPVAFVMLRVASEDIERAGYRIPKDSLVVVSPWASHRLPEVFPDPEKYWPDRFVQYPRAAKDLIGFGGGVHRCLGQHFAYLEMKVVISMLLRDYDFQLVDADPQPRSGARTKWPASPCRVRYARRIAGATA